MLYKCRVLKTFQSLPVGAICQLDKEYYNIRKKAGEVELIEEVLPASGKKKRAHKDATQEEEE